MSGYDQNFWEERWSQVLREHSDRVAQRPPNAHLTAELGDLRPERALDAGCGHGSDTLWSQSASTGPKPISEPGTLSGTNTTLSYVSTFT